LLAATATATRFGLALLSCHVRAGCGAFASHEQTNAATEQREDYEEDHAGQENELADGGLCVEECGFDRELGRGAEEEALDAKQIKLGYAAPGHQSRLNLGIVLVEQVWWSAQSKLYLLESGQ